jgi:guanosine-3',5'-bis(diphosphate) 3'-pyrophosphohydrolase
MSDRESKFIMSGRQGDQTISQGESISNIAIVLRAAEFAAHKHREQKRKGKSGRPYVGHCIEVARIIADVGGVDDANVLAAALLHDTVEDTGTTPEEIRSEFGFTIERLVTEVTDDKSLDDKERKRLQIMNAPHKSPGAKLIKLADKTSNVREIGVDPPTSWDVARRLQYFAWAEEVVNALGAVNPAMEELFRNTLALSRQQTPANPG